MRDRYLRTNHNNVTTTFRGGQADKTLKIMNILFALVMILKSALRSYDFYQESNDTAHYEDLYDGVAQTPWNELIYSFAFWGQSYADRDLGYSFFVKITQLVSVDFRFFLFIIAVIFVVPVAILIYRNVHTKIEVVISWLIYASLFSYLVDTAIKQSIVLGVIWASIGLIQKRKWYFYFPIVALCSTIHGSAILAIPLYFFPRFKQFKFLLVGVIISLPFLILYGRGLMMYLAADTIYEMYASYESQSKPVVYTIMMLLVVVATAMNYKKINLLENSSLYIGSVITAMALSTMAWIYPTLLRMTFYYSVFIIVLIPNIIRVMNASKEIKQIASYGLIIILASIFTIRYIL